MYILPDECNQKDVAFVWDYETEELLLCLPSIPKLAKKKWKIRIDFGFVVLRKYFCYIDFVLFPRFERIIEVHDEYRLRISDNKHQLNIVRSLE